MPLNNCNHYCVSGQKSLYVNNYYVCNSTHYLSHEKTFFNTSMNNRSCINVCLKIIFIILTF